MQNGPQYRESNGEYVPQCLESDSTVDLKCSQSNGCRVPQWRGEHHSRQIGFTEGRGAGSKVWFGKEHGRNMDNGNFVEASRGLVGGAEGMTINAVQTLYEVCRKTFPVTGPAPSPRAIQRVRSLLDTIKLADVGLSEDSLEQDRGYGFFGQNMQTNRHSTIVSRWSQPITYLHIYECDSFTMGIFCLPTSSTIPLHDHPGMTVLSKLLYGSVHVKAYDWIDSVNVQKNVNRSQSRIAKLKVDTVLTAPCETSILYPTTGGNIHSFTAVTSCAILDVLAPPYSDIAGRHCTYYCDFPYSSLPGNGRKRTDNGDSYAWLEESDPPDDFLVRGGRYMGPKVEA